MTQYKKGCLIYEKNKIICSGDIDIYFSEEGYIMDCYDNIFHKKFYESDEKTQNDITLFLKKRIEGNLKEKKVVRVQDKIRSITDELFEKLEPPETNAEVIYELITDENNNLYGKELMTGLLFPISEFSYQLSIYNTDEYTIFYTAKDRAFDFVERYPYGAARDSNDELHLLDRQGRINGIKISDEKKIIFHLKLKRELVPHHNNLVDNPENVLIKESGIALEFYKENYQRKFESLFGKLNLKNFQHHLEKMASGNTFKNEIVIREEETPKEVILLDQDNFSKHMETIEYLLLKLKKTDIDLYNKYQKEYNELLNNSEDTLNMQPLTIESLATLEANIEFGLYFGKNSSSENILKDLEKLKQEYLENIMNERKEKTKLTIKDLDKISELFLNVKDQYNPVDRRKILKNIALLYLMEVYENADIISIEELNNSYFKNNLKTIMICIESLIELNLINSSIYIDLNNEPTLENIFYIIRNIKFNASNPEAKKLIKKL